MAAMEFPATFIGWVRACVTSPMFSIMINGGLVGYFPGARGLRQGDPISPYLFLLVMEAFSSLLTWNIGQGEFTFHPKCQALGISHVIFADDLFLLSGAQEGSLQIILSTLREFHGFSGTTKLSFSVLMGIPEGKLPVKYLGVPLISTRLTSTDCSMLKEKILARIHSWTQKFLSYGGRAQLIQSVLFSIQTYWSSIFTLPQSILKEIEGVLSVFLWSGADLNILELSQKADNLWVKWVHVYILKGQSLWGIQCPSEASWVMRKLMKLRATCQSWIRYISLAMQFGEAVVTNRGLALRAKVASIIDQGQWKWPRIRNRAVLSIIRNTPEIFLPSTSDCDKVVWTLTFDGSFSVKSTWEACRKRNTIQPWYSLVWFSQGVLRWSFIEWLAILGRLSTRDRLFSWGVVVSPQCVLCMDDVESHDHLLFACHFSSDIRKQIRTHNGIHKAVLPLSLEVAWAVQSYAGKGFRNTIYKVSLAASVYFLWGERNARIFQGRSRSVTEVTNEIFDAVRAKLSSWSTVTFHTQNRGLCEDWLLDSRIFGINNCR
ncbi:uncharacterized protein LOC131306925 [Rhododendron vialii]|uniref:uncharacterized protein LOC131306925 n=1 Tax=Rhododendron vialii TaxID=182163 RepID=UPI00265E6922|nr:uncharacterized protein LOC131306925 [Rhododendron vialii]